MQNIIGGKWFSFLNTVLFMSMIAIVTSPVVWVWYGWTLSWKVFVTGLVVFGIFYGIDKVMRSVINDQIDKIKDKHSLSESKFAKKLREHEEKQKTK